LAVVVALAASGPAAGVTLPGPARNGLDPHAYRGQPPVAYVSRGHVFVLDGKGSPPRAIQQGRGSCCVAWAPDGAHLAFQRGAELWMSSADGEQTRRVAASVRRWAWSPDGEAIAVLPKASRNRNVTGIDFYAIDLPRVRLTLLRHDEVLDFAWAGLGRRIAVSARPATPTGQSGLIPSMLFMLEVPGPYGDCAALCPEPAQPIAIDNPSDANPSVYFAGWSPDVASLAIWTGPAGPDALVGGLDLSLISPGGGPTTHLVRTVVKRSWIQWQSSSDRLLAVEHRALGTGSVPVLTLCGISSGCRVVDPSAGPVVDPAWSDTGRMAYVTNPTARVVEAPGVPMRPDQASRVWVAGSEGQGATVVASGGASNPQWLPDGRHLLFVRRSTLWMLDPDIGSSVAIAGSLGVSPSALNIGGGASGQTADLQDGDQPFAVAP
jgi:dipeptidyl aminopeptidase/acylaminoacyl peptidase